MRTGMKESVILQIEQELLQKSIQKAQEEDKSISNLISFVMDHYFKYDCSLDFSSYGKRHIDQPLDEYIKEIEREEIIKTMEECDGNKTEAAKILNISYRSLWHKIDTMNIRYNER